MRYEKKKELLRIFNMQYGTPQTSILLCDFSYNKKRHPIWWVENTKNLKKSTIPPTVAFYKNFFNDENTFKLRNALQLLLHDYISIFLYKENIV